MEWMLMPLKRYADFSGRSQRQEYWMFVLGALIVALVLGFVEELLGMGRNGGFGSGILTIVFVVAIFLPALAVQVRRFHDQDKSGWFVLLSFIPFVGGIIVLVFMCLDGTPGPNRFGPDPKGRGAVDVFS